MLNKMGTAGKRVLLSGLTVGLLLVLSEVPPVALQLSDGHFANLIVEGNLGVGTSSPAARLDVRGDGRFGFNENYLRLGYASSFWGPDGYLIESVGPSTWPLLINDESHKPVIVGGNLTVRGDLSVDGTKSFVQDHPTDPTKEIVYISLEGPEAGTYIRGTAELINGEAVITLPEHFSMVTSEEGLTVQLTPLGEWLQLYVVEKSTTRLLVREAQGKSGRFDYLVQGVRKGYEAYQAIQEKVW